MGTPNGSRRSATPDRGARARRPNPVVALALAALAVIVPPYARADEPAGLRYRVGYTGEVFADVHGGMRRGTVYTGLLQGTLDWHGRGWSAHADAYLPHGDSLTAHDTGDFSVASNIDAVHQLRLHELWGERRNGKFSLRVGILAADTEFWGSDTAALFVSSAFGAPSVVSGNLPHSPIFPQGVPGLRLALVAGKADTLRLAVLDGDGGDPAGFNRHGLQFPFDHGVLLVFEDQHLFGNPASPWANARAGVFFHGGDFATTNGTIAHGAWGGVASIDHSLDERLVWFARFGCAQHDRSTVPWSVETGLNLGGVFGAKNTLGIGFAYVDLNDRFRTADNPLGLRHELIAETTLGVPFDERITVQPDLQYIIDPGGAPGARNAVVAGLRVIVTLGR